MNKGDDTPPLFIPIVLKTMEQEERIKHQIIYRKKKKIELTYKLNKEIARYKQEIAALDREINSLYMELQNGKASR